MRVGSCQATTVPGRTPMAYRPAAARSARSRSAPKVRVRSSARSSAASMRTGASGVRSARRETSSHRVAQLLGSVPMSVIPDLPWAWQSTVANMSDG